MDKLDQSSVTAKYKTEWTKGCDVGRCRKYCGRTDWKRLTPVCETPEEVALGLNLGRWEIKTTGNWKHFLSTQCWGWCFTRIISSVTHKRSEKVLVSFYTEETETEWVSNLPKVQPRKQWMLDLNTLLCLKTDALNPPLRSKSCNELLLLKGGRQTTTNLQSSPREQSEVWGCARSGHVWIILFNPNGSLEFIRQILDFMYISSDLTISLFYRCYYSIL